MQELLKSRLDLRKDSEADLHWEKNSPAEVLGPFP